MTEQNTQPAGSNRPVPTAEDIEKGKMMAIIAYLACCFLIPLLAARENKFAMYHLEQALVIFVLEIIGGVLAIAFIGYLIILFGWVLMVIGIINAAQGKCVPLPVIGKFGEKFNLMK